MGASTRRIEIEIGLGFGRNKYRCLNIKNLNRWEIVDEFVLFLSASFVVKQTTGWGFVCSISPPIFVLYFRLCRLCAFYIKQMSFMIFDQ